MLSLLRSQGQWLDSRSNRDRQIMLVLSLMIGALVGLVIVAFILLTGRLAARMVSTRQCRLAPGSDSYSGRSCNRRSADCTWTQEAVSSNRSRDRVCAGQRTRKA
jgi:hypothetical protein